MGRLKLSLIHNTLYWQLPTRGFSVTIYNSTGNQIDIAQIAIYNYFLQIKSNQIKCWFLVRGENWSTQGKTSHSRVENQQTQSTFDAECGNRTRATLVEGKCSDHNANPATFFFSVDVVQLVCNPNHKKFFICQGWERSKTRTASNGREQVGKHSTCNGSTMNWYWFK